MLAGSALGNRSTASPRYENTPSVTRNAMSITVNTGWRTQTSAIFMARLRGCRALPRYRLGPVRRFPNDISIVQLPRGRYGHAVAGFEAFRDLEPPSTVILGLPGRSDLVFVDAVPIEQEDFVHAIAVVHCRLGDEDRSFLFFARDGRLHKEAGFEA